VEMSLDLDLIPTGCLFLHIFVPLFQVCHSLAISGDLDQGEALHWKNSWALLSDRLFDQDILWKFSTGQSCVWLGDRFRLFDNKRITI
ncbi:MAG TPA: hypothetical protein VN653_14830, partial [Anaerolineales bacterium]|nr:hypothetical protein [Anaerolineales bacterium]